MRSSAVDFVPTVKVKMLVLLIVLFIIYKRTKMPTVFKLELVYSFFRYIFPVCDQEKLKGEYHFMLFNAYYQKHCPERLQHWPIGLM